MKEIIFLVEEAQEGGYLARALGESIFTEADSLLELRSKVRDAVQCHFDAEQMPKVIQCHIVRNEVFHVSGYLEMWTQTSWSGFRADTDTLSADKRHPTYV